MAYVNEFERICSEVASAHLCSSAHLTKLPPKRAVSVMYMYENMGIIRKTSAPTIYIKMKKRLLDALPCSQAPEPWPPPQPRNPGLGDQTARKCCYKPFVYFYLSPSIYINSFIYISLWLFTSSYRHLMKIFIEKV